MNRFWTYSTKALVLACLLHLSGCGGGEDNPSDSANTQEIPTSSELVFAERSLDLGISGEGMFVLRGRNGGQDSYSRYGRLGIDSEGRLIHADGSLVLGRNPESPDGIGPIPKVALRIPARATSRVRFDANLDARVSAAVETFGVGRYSTYNFATSLTVYAPTENTLTLYFRCERNSGGQNIWHVFAVLGQSEVVADAEIRFTAEGNMDLSWSSSLMIPVNAENAQIVLDLSSLHSYGSRFTVNGVENDGYPAGRLIDVLVDQAGVVTLQYDNGARLPGGQLVLARFNVADRLTRFGEKSWQCIRDCQAPTIDNPLSPLYGSIQQNALNVYY